MHVMFVSVRVCLCMHACMYVCNMQTCICICTYVCTFTHAFPAPTHHVLYSQRIGFAPHCDHIWKLDARTWCLREFLQMHGMECEAEKVCERVYESETPMCRQKEKAWGNVNDQDDKQFDLQDSSHSYVTIQGRHNIWTIKQELCYNIWFRMHTSWVCVRRMPFRCVDNEQKYNKMPWVAESGASDARKTAKQRKCPYWVGGLEWTVSINMVIHASRSKFQKAPTWNEADIIVYMHDHMYAEICAHTNGKYILLRSRGKTKRK